MSGHYDEKTLAFDTELLPELAGIGGTEDEWALGGISIRRSDRPVMKKERPTYRRGWTYPLEPAHRFVVVPFTRTSGERATAIVLRGGSEDVIGGWVRHDRSEEAESMAAKLNLELEQERRRYPGEGVALITLEVGSEQAPDAPFGRELVALSSSGAVTYERHDGGKVFGRRGVVDPARWYQLRAAIASTSFPSPAQDSFEPGASVMRLTVSGEEGGYVLLDYFDSLEMPGYQDAIRPLIELIEALRTEDLARLGAWSYVGDQRM
jgi:hypothetical protein